MDLRKIRLVVLWTRVLGIALIVAAVIFRDTPWLYIFGMVGILCGAVSPVLLILLWRCPACRKLLPSGEQMLELRTCPHCGKELELDEEQNCEPGA